MNQHVIFDIEIIGSAKPVFLVCTKIVETGEVRSFWYHKRGDMKRLGKFMDDPNYTWVGFNSMNFDAPLICAMRQGADPLWLKGAAGMIIEGQMRSWETYREFNIQYLEFDHIDLIEVAPGVMISLKTYGGRMNVKNMMDMPVHHDTDLTPKQMKLLEEYCLIDIAVTEELFNQLRERIDLRIQLGKEHGLELRSKSDAQVAEAILKKKLGIARMEKAKPSFVTYTAPDIIKTKSRPILEIIELMENTRFKINFANGSPEAPDWMTEPFKIGKGTYQVGMGGLHSTHDQKFFKQAGPDLMISDFDVASYYPNIIMKCGMTPRFQGNLGEQFIEAYEEIYRQRMEAKRTGNKVVDKSLKITLNGTFGKLGSIYSTFYSPDLLIGVTLTGQLNLLILIDKLERLKGVSVYSANTDGIMVGYLPSQREAVLKILADNSKSTGFDYEETPYRTVAMKDVNNYIAITTEGKAKRKGLYAKAGVEEMKNPTMEVCSNMATDYLTDGTLDIKRYTDMADFVAIRNVKGGGVQHLRTELVDDWEEVEPGHWSYPGMTTKPVKRKSRPAPREVGVDGTPFGRVARWYMTTEKLPPITYIGSGNKVPKTEGAKLCMSLPNKLPKDLDYGWYASETISMLEDMGVSVKI